MSTTKPETTVKAEETEKVKLAKPPTPEGKDFQAGQELTVGKSTATWLRKAGVVEKDQAAEASAAAVAKT